MRDHRGNQAAGRAKSGSIDCASAEVVWHPGKVVQAERARLLGQRPVTVWLTGLSGAGKSTLSFEVERRLVTRGHLAYAIDGDNFRHGLSRNLGFSSEDRRENIRRVAEAARLFNDAGLIVITSFISPYRQDRADARDIIGQERFIEAYVSTDIRTCEERDPKGLYRKARSGALAGFTGISAPYEEPDLPDLTLDTERETRDECVARILGKLEHFLLTASPAGIAETS